MPEPLTRRSIFASVQFVWWGWHWPMRIILPRNPGGLMANIYRRHAVIGPLEIRWWA